MSWTGVGLYSLQQAARLVGASPRQIRRWLFGYSYKREGDEHHIAALWETQFSESDVQLLGFRDLIEIRFVSAFVTRGVDLRVVRRCAATAREIFGSAYPFTMRRFRTDGKTIYHDAIKEVEGEGRLLDLHKRQLAFDSVVRPSLYRGLEFKEDGSALRWFPTRTDSIVVDPELAFGKPVLREFGVPTEAVMAHMRAERSKAKVARVLDLPVAMVDAAIHFEQRLAA